MADTKPIQSPTGTRDLYPIEAARRRFITEAWRRASINHGFEEVDGPTFESTELYTKKSGEGIVSEIFGVFSGKDEQGVKALGEKLARGEEAPAPYALRPEFTPTLARMYAARAASLPKPTRWFTAGPFFRAERPQRGRLREFLQWNCDVIGLALPEKPTPDDVARATAQADAEVIAACVGLFQSLGLSSDNVKVRVSDRNVIASILRDHSIPDERLTPALVLLDKRKKMTPAQFQEEFEVSVGDLQAFDRTCALCKTLVDGGAQGYTSGGSDRPDVRFDFMALRRLWAELQSLGIADWCVVDLSIARGLAYYTGMVFEVIVDGERAVAGGGRYDNLIELFGGPPTPAVGFGMGDVVLSLVLQDKGLLPSDAELMQIAGQSPDVFVISNGTPEADAALPSVLAELRRGTREQRGRDSLHARRTSKTTKNVGKLLQEAEKSGAHFAAIVESASEVTLKNLRTREQDQARTPIASLKAEVLRRLGRA